MSRPIVLVLTALLLASTLAVGIGASTPPASKVQVLREHDFPVMAELAYLADEFPLAPAPEGLSPEESARYWLRERDVHGRAPMDWVEWSRATFNVDLPRATPVEASDADVALSILRLYAALGLPMDATRMIQILVAADGVPAEIEPAFAELSDALATAYERQAVLAAGVLARFPADFDITKPFLTIEERDAMAANSAELLDALKLFDARTRGAFEAMPASSTPLFADPEGLVIVGSTGDDTYTRSGTILDPILVFEPGGADTYYTTAGGACPDPVHVAHRCNGLALAAVYDVDGNDRYDFQSEPSIAQGAGSIGGAGMLVDLAGDDSYYAKFTRAAKSAVFMYIDGGAQGFAQAGFGLQLDGNGDDVYNIEVASNRGRSIWAFGQGFGSLGSIGISTDVWGHDEWLTYGLGITGGNGGFQGVYTQGSGFYAGIGLMNDLGLGNDKYEAIDASTTTDYYAQGFGAFGGLGFMIEDGGDDTYYQLEAATDPFIVPLLNCAYGTGSLGGLGFFVDVSGNDHYWGDAISPRASHTMNEGYGGIGAAYGLFIDLDGNDVHEMYASGAAGSEVSGRGVAVTGGNIIGNYLDLGGIDTYVGPGADNEAWVAGADQNLASGFTL